MLQLSYGHHQQAGRPRSQGLSSYRPLERMRKDPGTRWSSATLTIVISNQQFVQFHPVVIAVSPLNALGQLLTNISQH